MNSLLMGIYPAFIPPREAQNKHPLSATMFPSSSKKRNIKVRRKFTLEEKLPEVTPELEIMVLEWLIKKCELREEYETAAEALGRIQELKEEMIT